MGRSPTAWPKRPDGSHCGGTSCFELGVTKGRVGAGSSRDAIVDAARRDDPPDFWVGWQLAFVDEDGDATRLRRRSSTSIARAAACVFADWRHSPAPSAAYELRCELEAPVVAIRYLLGLPLAEPVPPDRAAAGHDARHQCAHHPQRRADGPRHHARLRRRAGNRLPGPAAAVRSHGSQAAAAHGRGRRNRRARDARRPGAGRAARSRRCGSNCNRSRDAGIESLAICLLHADRHPSHEQLVARIAREVGFREISCVARSRRRCRRFVARADTTVVDAYLNPVLRDYVARLRGGAAGQPDCGCSRRPAGWWRRSSFCGKDSILSGPAGGVVGFSRVAQAAGFARGDRLRHGRHEHRRARGSTAASSWNTKRKRPACGSSRRRWRSKPSRPAAVRSAGSTA